MIIKHRSHNTITEYLILHLTDKDLIERYIEHLKAHLPLEFKWKRGYWYRRDIKELLCIKPRNQQEEYDPCVFIEVIHKRNPDREAIQRVLEFSFYLTKKYRFDRNLLENCYKLDPYVDEEHTYVRPDETHDWVNSHE